MMIATLDPSSRTHQNIRKLERNTGIRVLALTPREVHAICLPGNRTPDDLLLAILCHKYNHQMAIAVAKPPLRNLSTT